MSESKEDPSPKDCKEELAGLNNLKEKLVTLEAVRARQSTVKTVGLITIAVIFFSLCFNLYSSYKNFDQDKFSAQMEKEMQEVFKPRLEYLSQKSEKEILPLIKKTVSETLNKKLPEIRERINKIGERVHDSMRDKLALSLESMLKEIEADLKSEIGDETFEIVLDNAEFEAMVAEEVYLQIEGSEEVVENFRAEIEYLKQENPEIMNIPAEKAEKIFLTSLLDLMKYDVDPELGQKPAMGGK